MEPRTILRAAALAVLGAALLVTAVAVHRQPEASALVTRVVPERKGDVSAELAHCRSLGLAAADDPECKRVWSGARERFFGTGDGER